VAVNYMYYIRKKIKKKLDLIKKKLL